MSLPHIVLPASPPRIVPSDASRRGGWRLGWTAIAAAAITAAWLVVQG